MDQKLFDALQNVLNKYFLNNKKFDIANSINFVNKATIFLKDIQEISEDIIEQNLQYGVELFLTQQVLQSKNYIDWVRGGNILRGAGYLCAGIVGAILTCVAVSLSPIAIIPVTTIIIISEINSECEKYFNKTIELVKASKNQNQELIAIINKYESKNLLESPIISEQPRVSPIESSQSPIISEQPRVSPIESSQSPIISEPHQLQAQISAEMIAQTRVNIASIITKSKELSEMWRKAYDIDKVKAQDLIKTNMENSLSNVKDIEKIAKNINKIDLDTIAKVNKLLNDTNVIVEKFKESYMKLYTNININFFDYLKKYAKFVFMTCNAIKPDFSSFLLDYLNAFKRDDLKKILFLKRFFFYKSAYYNINKHECDDIEEKIIQEILQNRPLSDNVIEISSESLLNKIKDFEIENLKDKQNVNTYHMKIKNKKIITNFDYEWPEGTSGGDATHLNAILAKYDRYKIIQKYI